MSNDYKILYVIIKKINRICIWYTYPIYFLFNKCIKIKNSHLFKGIKNSDKIESNFNILIKEGLMSNKIP